MKFDKILVGFAAALLAVACSESSSAGSVNRADAGQSNNGIKIDTVEAYDDLYNCTMKKEDVRVYIEEERAVYICADADWQFVSRFIDSLKTEDDLPACTKRKNGRPIYVEEDNSIYLCANTKWYNVGEVVASEEELKICSSRREDDLAYIVDQGKSLVCRDGKWVDYFLGY